MTIPASDPAPLDAEAALQSAATYHDDVAAGRILKLAEEIRRELRGMHSETRGRRCRSIAVAQIGGKVAFGEWFDKVEALYNDLT